MSKMAIVGCDASGKTVLISSLSDYYRAGRRAGQSCIMVPADSLTRRYTDNLHRVMRINGEWPEATSDISVGTTLKWKLMRDGKELADLELLDFGGENFRYAFRNDGTEKNPEAVAQLKDYIAGADFIVITVSMDKMVRNLTPSLYRELENGDIEYDRDAEAQWVTEGLLRMVAAKIASDPPGVVVALTQADKHRKELEEYGGAKALFEKCWPMVATMYPNLDVVPCASIDKMSDKGLPADGYSTEGVIAVMKEFSRYAFGDCDDIEGIRPGATPVATPAAAAPAQTEGATAKPDATEPSADRMQNASSAVRVVGLLAILAAVVYFGVKMLSQPQSASVPPADDTAKELMRTQEFARMQEQARKAREAEEARKRAEEALAQAQAKARELEEARKSREAEEARKRAEAEQTRKAREAEEARKRAEEEQARKAEETRRIREAEEARKRAEAELAKERAAAERARQERAAAERARQEKAAAEKAAAEKAAAGRPKVSPDEMLRLRAEEREMKYQELRERQRLEREQMETAGLMTSLVDSVNRAHLERGRNLIADLSGERKLTSGQRDILDYARTFMDHLEKAQNENADDMVWIGNQYYTAEGSAGIVKSPREALSWYRKAAAIGSSQAYYFMSLMTEQGEGVRKDEALAGRYCLKAARLGNAEAMFWIGVYCNEGTHGFEKSPATAYKFLSMARNAGFENAGLDRLIRRVQDESDGDTIDGWFPDDPLQEPVKPDPKEERPWWKLGIF